MNMRIKILLLSLFVPVLIAAQSIKISIFNSYEINSLTLSIKQGKYVLKNGNETLGEYKRGTIFHISRFSNTLEIRDKQNFIGNFNSVELFSTEGNGILSIEPINPPMESREYDDNISLMVKGNKIMLINKLDMEKYVAAVIEAEGGNNAPLEYYKAQAILIRTFTIKNLFKHAEDGFDLCDEVHCQSYRGRCSQHPEIVEATQSTAGKVLVDQSNILIMSPFHSNCGGMTSSAGIVWQKDLPYLASVRDPFCSNSLHATWTYSISREAWNTFIADYTKKNIDYTRYNFSFTFPSRTRSILIHGIELNLRTVREYFGLKSAFFDIEDTGDSLIFKGKGYGHGVGLCQEGAMEMARVGYCWLDIIHFYFRDVNVVDYREMPLHRFKPE
jgi:stage II sporulation protein D